jgi:hypothetical protein
LTDNTRYPGLIAYDVNNNNEIPYETDARGFIREGRRIRNGVWFPYYLEDNICSYLSEYQIFNKEQLDYYKKDEINKFTEHSFINSMRYYNID